MSLDRKDKVHSRLLISPTSFKQNTHTPNHDVTVHIPLRWVRDPGLPSWSGQTPRQAVTSGAQDTSEVIEHVGDFSGSTCKACVPKSSSKPLKVGPILEPGFNFLSSNAAIFKLSTTAADGHMPVVWDSTRILKSDHATRRRNDSTACDWAKVPTSEDDDGRMIISAIRGNSNGSIADFVPLSGEDGTPYTVEIEWQSLKIVSTKGGRSNRTHERTPTPPAVLTEHAEPSEVPSNQPVANKAARSRKQNESAKTHPVQRATEPQASQDNETTSGPTARPSARIQADSQASSSGRSGIFTTPPDVFIDFDKTPDRLPDTQNRRGLSEIGPTPTQARDTPTVERPTLKRSAKAAFGPDDEYDMKRLRFELREAEAVFEVAEAKVEQTAYEQGLDDKAGRLLLLDKAEAYYQVVYAELELKAAGIGDEKDAEYFTISTRKAEAHLAIREAEEKTLAQSSLDFKLRKAEAKLEVANAKLQQMANEVRDLYGSNVQCLQMLLGKAQAVHDVVEAEFHLKAANVGRDRNGEYFEIKTRKAEAHLMVVEAEGKLMLATESQR
jgi:hypothetical protein